MPLPTVNLDDRHFQDIVDEAKTRIPTYCPEWTDHNVSDPGVALPAAVGLADMRAIILRAAGAEMPAPAHRGVFQYLGDLDRPAVIGSVSPGGEWIRFDLFREAVWTSRSGRWTPYARLAGAEREAADALIDRWARERWLRHLDGPRS